MPEFKTINEPLWPYADTDLLSQYGANFAAGEHCDLRQPRLIVGSDPLSCPIPMI